MRSGADRSGMAKLDLETGLTLLRVPTPRSGAIHRIVCDRLRETEGPAYWIDARNVASTHALYDCAPSPRTLAPLRIARAFTAYQHHALVRRVTRRAAPETALVVAPNAVDLYRDDDLEGWEREDLLASTLATLRELGRAIDCPVLVTAADDDAERAIDPRADAAIECVRTREGYRLSGDGATTDGYWRGDCWQTTIPYWVDVCGAIEAIDPVVAAHDRGLLEVSA